MTFKQILPLLAIVAIIPVNSAAQTNSLQGLWLIDHVQAGDQEMTPVAKWTRIHADGTYQSGNGWLQSSEGTWTYDEAEKAFLPKETNGLELKDPHGAFTVQFNSDGMTWTREEEGMQVTVTLKQIRELPMAPADRVQGLWDLTGAARGDVSIMESVDPEGSHYLFIRWDRIYVERDGNGSRSTGYWHMDGHRPEMTLLSHNEGAEPGSWSVSFSPNEEMILHGISDSNRGEKRTYSRIHQFPE